MGLKLFYFDVTICKHVSLWHVKHVFEKNSETLNEDNAGKGYNCLIDLVVDFEEALTPLRFKHLIKFSSLLMWIMSPKVYYFQLICTFKKIEVETAFNTQLQHAFQRIDS